MKMEVRPVNSVALESGFQQVPWGSPGSEESEVQSSVDPWLSQLGEVGDATIDLVRLSAGAYLADRSSRRGAGFSRTIRLHIQLVDAAAWTSLLPDLEHLLSWVSGDEWQLTVSSERVTRDPGAVQTSIPNDRLDEVALLSGGLDSFSAAALGDTVKVFASHTDSRIISAAQNRSWSWLEGAGVEGDRVRVALSEAGAKREGSTRTRAVLFYALAVALADVRGLERVQVPENGFTSLNLSLGNDRGGVLSTRSTHPWTMHLFQTILDEAGIEVRLLNPHEWQTKGELVAQAAQESVADFAAGVSTTLSCAKLDGRTYKGGNPHLNCGLCVACLTRRASIRAAGIVPDPTQYLSTTLKGSSLQQLRERRGGDVRAVLARVEDDVDDFTLLEAGPYPDDYDLAAAAELCNRGFSELRTLLGDLV